MKTNNSILTETMQGDIDLSDSPVRDIASQLSQIVQFMEQELGNKQQIIEAQLLDIKKLTTEADSKDVVINSLKEQLELCGTQVESNRQLINKLLGDISHYQNDIEWYKKTYQKRSLLGVIKDKLTSSSNK